MKARGVRLHAANDLRLEEFELPEITDDEILVKVVSDSICMSTYKCAILGTDHKRVHEDVAEHPAIMGHEFAGDIVKDGQINIYDLSAVVSYFGTDNLVENHKEYAKYDLNRDGVIDSKDVAYVLVSWGK